MKKGRFLALFLALFAAILVLWMRADGAYWYTRLLLAVGSVVGPTVHGWILEQALPRPVWVHGVARVELSIQLDALAVAQVPLAALLAATPGFSASRRLATMAAGFVLCFVFHVLVVVLFPLLVYHKNPLTDVAGTFLGLIAFAGAPVILWFILAFDEIRKWLPGFRNHLDA